MERSEQPGCLSLLYPHVELGLSPEYRTVLADIDSLLDMLRQLLSVASSSQEVTFDNVANLLMKINQLEFSYRRYHKQQVSLVLAQINQLIYLKTLQLFPTQQFFVTASSILFIKTMSALGFQQFIDMTSEADRQLAEFYVPIKKNDIVGWIETARTVCAEPSKINQSDVLNLVYELNLISHPSSLAQVKA